MFCLAVYCRVFVALFLLNLLPAGCDRQISSTQQESPTTAVQVEPTPNVSEQPKLPTTPQKACGDALPKDANVYPVSLYPVFVDYNERNLELVKQHFCEDALKRFRDKTGKDMIQVASFTSQETSNQFKEKLAQHFSGAEVGSPTIVEKLRSDINTEDDNCSSDSLVIVDPAQSLQPPNLNNIIQPKDLERVSGLTRDQVNKLLKIHCRQIVDSENKESMKFRVILPTYLPDGFRVTQFNLRDPGKKVYFFRENPLSYEISYQNATGSTCFSFQADNGQWGGMPVGSSPIEVTSSVFGKALIRQTEFDRRNPGFTEFRKDVLHPFKTTYYMVAKGLSSLESNSSSLKSQSCEAELPLNEAVKIVQSMKYIR